jgi:hypothetical protein
VINPELRRTLGRQRHRRKYNILPDIKKYDGLIWLRIGKSGGS